MGTEAGERVFLSLSARRAWIEIQLSTDEAGEVASLSARRAWIEIDFAGSAWVPEFVALRKESVDRNRQCGVVAGRLFQSLSARRAWIEI